MNDANYVVYHLHSDLSNSLTPDSTSKYQEYIDLAVKNNMKAISFSEHGGVFEWISKKQACDKAGLKYIHGMEAYCTTTLNEQLRESFHIGLYAKNWDGVKEINSLSSKSYIREDGHFYFRPRISIDEIYNTSDNIIVTTACLGSPLWQLRNDENFINRFLEWVAENKDRVFLEIQYHDHHEQIEYNQMLYRWSKEYDLKLIAGSDTHSSTEYTAECRSMLQKSKNMSYGDEDSFDLTFKSYDEFVKKFEEQNALPKDVYMQAIDNTNLLASMIEDFELDRSFKYPDLYKDDESVYKKLVTQKYNEKLRNGAIDDSDGYYKKKIQEETRAFKKLGMFSYMSFISELSTWCEEQGIPRGTSRGSVAGSLVAYILDITDVDPLKWGTVFSRFCNEDRVSLADIDLDFSPDQRDFVFKYIEDRFPENHTAHIITYNTIADKGTIDEIGRGLKIPLPEVAKIKTEYESNPDKTRKKYPNVFYYFDGMVGTVISKGVHPAGMVASPIPLNEEIGLIYDEGVPVVQCAMNSIESVNFVKFDILGLKNIGILKNTFELLNKRYMKSHEVNWNDDNVWRDMIKSPVGVFQFEADYAFSMLKRFEPKSVHDMSLVNAAIRPSGDSYRDDLMNKIFHKNPSKEIDKLLEKNNGYLVFQEDSILFLTEICGLSGAEADNIRRAIGAKDREAINEAMPQILEGYCSNSNKPREIAVEEAKEFLKIIEDSSDYQFNLNHSIGYSMVGYMCAMLRHYHPLEFITAFLNNAQNEDDVINGTKLANDKGIRILPPKFGGSSATYTPNKEENAIYKGLASIKYLNTRIAEELFDLSRNKYDTFTELLIDIAEKTTVNSKQLDILIKLNFFEQFGTIERLLAINENFINGKEKYKKTYVPKTKEKRIPLLIQYENETDNIIPFSVADRIIFEIEHLGYTDLTIDVDNSQAIILDIFSKYKNPVLTLYQVSTGKEIVAKMKANTFYVNGQDLVKVGDHVSVKSTYTDYKWRKGEDGFYQDKTQKELFISNLELLN